MKQKFRTFSRTTQLAIIMALILPVGIVTYAAINAWISKTWISTLTKGNVMEMKQGSATGEVLPGQSFPFSPIIKNVGSKQVLAFMKVEMPSYSTSTGEQKETYTFTADGSWTKVVDDGSTVVYGYSSALSPDEETATVLCDSMTMMNMSGSEFMTMSDVNVRLTGYLADTSEYGKDPVRVWAAIGE